MRLIDGAPRWRPACGLGPPPPLEIAPQPNLQFEREEETGTTLSEGWFGDAVRWLIDGYNLMHAAGMLDHDRRSREVFRRKRRQFLARLADALGSARTVETTVVFDASVPPGDFPPASVYQGMTVLFALDDEDADTLIERLIREASAPKKLTVVSTDRRVRQAATRRRAQALTAEAFLDLLDRSRRDVQRRARGGNLDRADQGHGGNDPTVELAERAAAVSPEELDFWLEEFRDLEDAPEWKEPLLSPPPLLTDAEIAQIQREIDREP